MKRITLAVIAISFILGFLYWYIGTDSWVSEPKEQGPITINYWGFEDERVIKEIINDYQTKNPNIKVVYTPQNLLNYRTRVQTQIRNGVGPDLLTIHNSWMRMFLPDLSAAPREVFSEAEYKKIFYPVAVTSLLYGSNVLAVPLSLDGLVMYVNEDILKAAGLNIPTNWQEFVSAATTVTVKDTQGSIQTAGSALGLTTNIDFWPDILGLLFIQQPKVDILSPATAEGAEVLKFYTGFVIDPKLKTWDNSLPSSTKQFIDGKLAFYFAPSSQIEVIKSQNPTLNFKTVPVPQLPGKPSAWGSFWTVGVSKYSSKTQQAWSFLKYLTSEEVQKKIQDQKAQLGLYPLPFARMSLAKEQVNDPLLGAFIKQGSYYKSWYLNSKTLDSGVNDEVIALFEKAVNAVLAGQDPLSALNSIQSGVNQVVDKYNVVSLK